MASTAVDRPDEITFTTVGIDIGSATAHLMLGRVRMRRLAQELSSRYVVVDRETLWKSEVILTPYRGSEIDAGVLEAFFSRCYQQARITPEHVDTGVVTLTGEALKQGNAARIARMLATSRGRFVCTLAGWYREAVLSAKGSGAAALSRSLGQPILHVDIGGGTTKLALVHAGEVHSAAVLGVGARLLTWDDDRRLRSVSSSITKLANRLGFDVVPGAPFDEASESAVVRTMIDAVRVGARGEHLQGVGATLQLSAPLMLDPAPELLTCSGGVAEFIYGREKRGFGDLGAALGRQLVDAVTTGAIPLPLANLDRGIRATVTGLSQFSTQLSGSTMACSNESVLPLRDVPVAGPGIVIDDDVTPAQIAELIRRNVRASGTDTTGAVALPLEWATRPTYDRLRTAADGIVEGIGHEAAQTPLVVILDTDLAASLGAILTSEHRLGRPVVSLDSVEVGEGDFIDIGCRTVPGGLVPIVSKTLLFPEAAGSIRRDTD